MASRKERSRRSVAALGPGHHFWDHPRLERLDFLCDNAVELSPMTEHLPDALALTGLALTALFGIWPLVLAYRALRYPACITYVSCKVLPSFGTVVQRLPELSVFLDGEPLGSEVLLLEGALVCNGSRDITAAMVANQLTLRMDGWRWLAVGHIEASPGLQPEIKIQRSPIDSVRVDFGPLFRRGEYIAFTALLQPLSEQAVWTTVSCHHGIADTQVDRISAPTRSFRPMFALWLSMLLALIMPVSCASLQERSLSPAIWTGLFSMLVLMVIAFRHIHQRRAVRFLPKDLLPLYP